MRIRAGYRITYDCPVETPMLMMVNLRPERAGDLEPVALVVDRLGVEPGQPVGVETQRSVVPQRSHDVEELVCARVAGLAIQMLLQAVVQRELIDHRGDGVVPGATVRGLVE